MFIIPFYCSLSATKSLGGKTKTASMHLYQVFRNLVINSNNQKDRLPPHSDESVKMISTGTSSMAGSENVCIIVAYTMMMLGAFPYLVDIPSNYALAYNITHILLSIVVLDYMCNIALHIFINKLEMWLEELQRSSKTPSSLLKNVQADIEYMKTRTENKKFLRPAIVLYGFWLPRVIRGWEAYVRKMSEDTTEANEKKGEKLLDSATQIRDKQGYGIVGPDLEKGPLN